MAYKTKMQYEKKNHNGETFHLAAVQLDGFTLANVFISDNAPETHVDENWLVLFTMGRTQLNLGVFPSLEIAQRVADAHVRDMITVLSQWIGEDE